jgi:hypothetical protein
MCRSYGEIAQNTCVEGAPGTRMVCSKVNIVEPLQVRQKLYYFLNVKILENQGPFLLEIYKIIVY